MGGHKKVVFISIVIIALLCLSTVAAAGGGGVTGNATEITQLFNHSELATQILKQVEQIENQLAMLDDMAKNFASIPEQLFGNVTQIYSRIKGVMDKTKGVAYTMTNLDVEMKNRFKSYSNMSDLRTAKDFQQEYRQIINTQMETTRSTLESLGVAWNQLENEDTKTLEQLQGIANSSKGRNEIMQITNQFLGFLSEESLKLRQTIMMQTHMMAVALETERAEKDAAQKRHEDSLSGLGKRFETYDDIDFSTPDITY